MDANENTDHKWSLYSKEGYAGAGYQELEVTYLDFSASWSWLSLPLSIVSLPVGQQFIAIVFMILAFAVWAVSREKRRGKNRR
jgi:uncharacterized protein (DUF2062 family)